MKIDIIIPHYGDTQPTLALIEQLRHQSSQIIVVDDHSPLPFPDTSGVEVTRRSFNGGFGSAVNTAAALAEGDAILVLNSDLTVPEEFVSQLKVAAEPYWPSVVSPRVLNSDHQPVWVGRKFPLVRHQVVEWLTPLARWRHTPWWHRAVGHELLKDGADGNEVDWVIGAAMLIPLDHFRAVGGFDERFFMNCEEVDLQVRLRRLGLASVALMHPTVIHAGGGSSPTANRRRWLVESRMQYAAKWGSRGTLRAALTVATALNFVVNSGRWLAGRPAQPLRTARAELKLLHGGKGQIR